MAGRPERIGAGTREAVKDAHGFILKQARRTTRLYRSCDARIFADDKPQCMRVGEMQLPREQGVIDEDDIAGELGEVLAGKLAGRTSDEEITIFDATGLAPLDLVTAKVAIESAVDKGIGTRVDM